MTNWETDLFGLQQDDLDFNEIFSEYFINEFDDPLNAYTNSMANNYNNLNFDSSTIAQAYAPDNTPKVNNKVNLPTGGIRTVFHGSVEQANAVPPPTKKPKIDDPPKPMMPPAAPGVSLPVGVGIRLGGLGGIAPSTAQSAARLAGIQSQFMMWGGDDGAPEHVVAERRQRNREHAKRSRVRKKFMLESMQQQVLDLQRENQRLRMLVQEHIPEHSQQIITECCHPNPLFADPDELGFTTDETMDQADSALMNSLATGQKCFVLSDPKLPDNPIVFASQGFYDLTGYTSKEVLGRNCRFLQGPGTDPKHVEVIRKAVATGSDCTVCILNYKADGTPFWNQFFLASLRDSDNSIVNYVSRSCRCGGIVGTFKRSLCYLHCTFSFDRSVFKRKSNRIWGLVCWRRR